MPDPVSDSLPATAAGKTYRTSPCGSPYHYTGRPCGCSGVTAAPDSSLDGVRQAVLAEFWGALASDARRAADGWFWHEDELDDVLRSFGLLDRNEVFRGQ